MRPIGDMRSCSSEPGRGYIALAFLDVQAVPSFVSVPRQLELRAASWSRHALRNACAVTTTWLPSIVPDKTAPEPGRGYVALAFLDVQAVLSFVSVPR